MLSFVYVDGRLTEVTSDYRPGAKDRNDFATMSAAGKVAVDATVLTGRLHIAVDAGPNVSPRYDVIEAPTVGAEVSRSFNGDYYPAGKIVKVSASLRRVQTDTGVVFYRRGMSAAWVNAGTWAMVAGSINRRSLEF